MRSARKARAGKEPARLLALSDGLFATVLTVLVLDLRVQKHLASRGAVLITSYGGLVLAFLVTC